MLRQLSRGLGRFTSQHRIVQPRVVTSRWQSTLVVAMEAEAAEFQEVVEHCSHPTHYFTLNNNP